MTNTVNKSRAQLGAKAALGEPRRVSPAASRS